MTTLPVCLMLFSVSEKSRCIVEAFASSETLGGELVVGDQVRSKTHATEFAAGWWRARGQQPPRREGGVSPVFRCVT